MPDHCRDRSLPRVLFAAEIDPSPKFGTFEEQTLSLARAFHEQSGLFLPLYSSPLGPRAAGDYQALGLHAESLDLRRFRPATLARLAALIRTHKIEVVHWNFYEPIKNGYLWGLGILTPSVRHFFTDHTSRATNSTVGSGRFKNMCKRLVYRRYEKIFGVSDFISRSLQGGGGWPNVSRWTHLVNTDRFSPDSLVRKEVRQRLGIGDDRFVALVVAALMPEKGVEVAIRAFRNLPETAELWIVGGGESAASLEALAQRLSLGDRVRFLGVRRDVADFMRAADCLVCPSLWAEAAGLVNVEALACGLPVVASRIGGIPEYVNDGRTGLLFPPGDAPSLSDALRRLQKEPATCGAMSFAARETALAHYSIQNRLGEYLNHYRRTPIREPEHADTVYANA